MADFNGDGKKDLAYVAHDNNLYDLSVLPGNGDGSFGARVSHYMGYGYYCHFIRTADLDEDGSPDLVFGGNDHLTVATNRGDGSFGFDLVRQNRGDTLNTSHGDTYGVAAGDLNGDGILELVATDHSDSVLRVFDGLPKALLAADDTATNVLHGYGRGFLSDGGDVDFWSFSATRGQVLTVAVDMAGFAGNPGHNWAIYDEAGNALTSFYNQNNWRGQSPPLVIPRDGTYHLRVAEWYGYRGEYRFRTSLAPAGTQIETEDNNAISQSNSVAFTLAGNSLSATTGGYVAAYDAPGDYFNLGNLAAGTQVTANLRLPSTSTLAPALTLFKANGTAVTPDTISPTQLVFTLTASDAAAYHLRVTDTAGRGLMAEYFVDLKVEDVVAPTIVSDTLPAEGSSANFFGASFTLNFSEDMLFPTVRETANYELLASGGDGDFTSGNEQIYTLAPAAYSSGLSNSYTITDGPMQPDVYRFTAKAALRDKLDNPLAADYVRTWTITGLAGFVSESRSNNTRGTADRLSVNVLAGEADGSFQDRGRAVATAGWPFDVELADLDGDNKLDAVVTHLGTVDGISIRPGNGDRTFGLAIEFPGLGDEPYDVHLLKVDEDNKLDLAVLVPGSDKVAFFRNTSTPGSLAFVREADVTVGDEPYRLASADLNGDTYMDLVVSNHGTNASSGRCVSVLINNQSGGFTESKLGTGLTPRIRPWAITLTDFNGDTKADLVAGDMDNGKRLALWLGNGDGSFGAPSFTDLPDNPNPADFAVADFNGDGKKDLAYVAHDNNLYDLSVLPGNGDGSFGARVSHYMGYGYYCHFIRTADLDEDGSPDLVFGGNDHLTVATNRGDGSFGFDLVRQNRGDTLNTSHGDTYGVAAGDLNGDGILELVATDHSDSVLRVFDGLPKALLAADDTATNVLHGYGRGFLSDGGDVDFWSFSATRGQVLTVAVDMAGFCGQPRSQLGDL